MKQTKQFKRTAFNLSAKSMVSLMLLLIAMLMPQGAWAEETDSRLELLTVDEGITVTLEDNGDYPWVVGNYGENQIPALVTSNKNSNNSYSETTIKLNSQQNIFLSFDYAVSSEARYDKLTIWVDGKIVVNAISGVESASFPRTLLEANESGHTIKLYYKKDSSGNGNDDCCYLYNFKAEAHEHTFTSFSHKCDVCGTIIDHVHNFDHDYHCNMCDLSEPRFAIFNLEGALATFEDNGDYPWASGTYNETPAIVSTNVNDASSAISETTVKLNCQQNVVLSLDYAVSSMENKGSLTINLDGKTIVNEISGAESGSLEGLYLSASGTPHALTFIFKPGLYGINENECGYIYNVKTVAHEHTFTSFTHKCDGCEYVKEHEHQMNSDNHCTLCNFYDPRNQVISVEGVTFAFVDNGNYPWAYTEINNAQDGIGPLMSTPALKSTNKGKSSTNSELTINLTSQQAVNLSFDYAVSSEENYDKLIIEVDNRKVAEISGITNSSYSGVLPANTTHTITLKYSKDNSGNRENDCAYVYNIKAIENSTHNYTVSSCDWSDDNTSATLHLACECGETADVEATSITKTVVEAPTCTEVGYSTITASVEYEGQNLTASKDETIPILPHTFADADTDATHCTTCGHWFVRYTTSDTEDLYSILGNVIPMDNAEKQAIDITSIKGVVGHDFVAYQNYGAGYIEFTKDEITIGEKTFFQSNLSSIILPNVKEIDLSAFAGCHSLTKVAAPKATTIGDYAFSGCNNLSSIDLSMASTIGTEAFWNCNSLQTISLPKVTNIGNDAFMDCSNLTNLTVPCTFDISGVAISQYLIVTRNHVSKEISVEVKEATCTEEGYDAYTYCDACENLVEKVIRQATDHSFTNGVCTVCDYECLHQYVAYDKNIHDCSICGHTDHHRWENGSCADCYYPCNHRYEDGVCTTCGYECQHRISADLDMHWCYICDIKESHRWNPDSECTVCGYECGHEWNLEETCTICGKEKYESLKDCGEWTIAFYAPIGQDLSKIDNYATVRRFIAPEAGVYIFQTKGPNDTYGRFFDESDLVVDDDNSGEDNNFRLIRRMEAGEKVLLAMALSGATETELVWSLFYIQKCQHTYEVTSDWTKEITFNMNGGSQSGDYTSATLHLKCNVCGNTADVETTSITKTEKAPTCTEKGERTYSATVTYEGVEYSDTNTEDIAIDPNAHDFRSKTLTAEPDEHGLYAYVCDHDCGTKTAYNIVKYGDGKGQSFKKADDDGTGSINVGDGMTVTCGNTSFSTTMEFVASGDQVSVDRTFTAGTPATVMLPFSVQASEISGATVYEFKGVKYENGAWVADMTPVSGTLQPYKPYTVIPTAENISIAGTAFVTFITTPNASDMKTTDENGWTFNAVNTPKTWTAGDLELGKAYGFAGEAREVNGVSIAKGQFVKLAAGATAAPGRCYLTKENADWSQQNARRRGVAAEELPSSIVVRFINGEATGIATLNTENGELILEGWYDLNGRKINAPAKGGIYVKDGKKVLVK